MEIEIACGTWMKEADEQIFHALRQADHWLTADELEAATGLPHSRIQRSLSLLRQSMDMAKARKDFLAPQQQEG